jgi:murein DD-endopeptidase MepM/ murein hydrolase activator NlpD
MQKIFRCGVMVVLLSTLAACASGGLVGNGYYKVKRGDTLGSVARRTGQSVRDLTRWNNLSNPNLISAGQMLRVVPPGRATASARPAPDAAGDSSSSSSAAAPATATAAPSQAPTSAIALIWPAKGTVLRGFDGVRSKGVDIGGQVGDAVSAAAAGTVVYAGNGLRGYGNLLIIKHNANFLTAYAHNRKLLVKEGQAITQGQAIAEMGDTDSSRVMLHFELRYQGRSIDPARYLPAR